MKKILVPIDFSPASRHAAEYAALLAKATGAGLELLHVYKDLIPATVGAEPWTITVNELVVKKEARLREEEDFLTGKYGIQVTSNIRNGFKISSIRNFLKQANADLIVAGFKNDHPLTDSTVFRMIRRMPAPVLIIPEEAPLVPFGKIVLAVEFYQLPKDGCLDPLFNIISAFNASLRVLHIEKRGAEIDLNEMEGKLELGRRLGSVSFLYDKVENDETGQGILKFVKDHPTDLLAMIAHHHGFLYQVLRPDHIVAVSYRLPVPLLVLKSS